MNDTTPDMAAMVRRLLLARSGEERLAMGSQMFDVARAIVLASMPAGLSDLEIRIRLCEWIYGDQVDLEAFASRLSSR